MRVLAKCRIQIGDVLIEPNRLVEVPDCVAKDKYFELCLQSGLVQTFETAPKKVQSRRRKK